MIDSKQTEMWEELEQLRQSCIMAANREQDEIHEGTAYEPSAGELLGVILCLAIIVILAWLALTSPDFFGTMQNIMCPPGSSNFGC